MLNKPTWMALNTWVDFRKQHGEHPICVTRGCQNPADTVDHIIPKHKGGSDELSNLQPMCRRCNSKKGVHPDTYWKTKFYFDHPFQADKARTAQRMQGFERVIDYAEWFKRPWSQIARKLYTCAWVVGAGKTFGPLAIAFGLNFVIRRDLGEGIPRVNRILILTKETGLRDQIAVEMRKELVQYGLCTSAPRVKTIDSGRQLYDYFSYENADIFVACTAMFYEENGQPRKDLETILAHFPLIAIDEPHHATEQVLKIVDAAATSLCFGFTGTPIEASGETLKRFVLFSLFTYQDAIQYDKSMKFVSDKEQHFRLQVEETDISEAKIIAEKGFERTDDPTQDGYDKNAAPRKTVAEAVARHLDRCDHLSARQHWQASEHRTIFSQDSTKIKKDHYPVHAMIVADQIEIGESLCQMLNSMFEANRHKYPREDGWAAEVVYSASEIGDKKRSVKPLTPKHPWFRYKQQGQIDEKCCRILIVIGMGREGINNPFCACVGYACESESSVEWIQRGIGRQARGCAKEIQDTLFTPTWRLDTIYIITHKSFTKNVPAIQKALKFICNMGDALEDMTDIEELMRDMEKSGNDGIDPESLPLTTKEKIGIAAEIGRRYLRKEPTDAVFVNSLENSWGGQDAKKRERVGKWANKVIERPDAAKREIDHRADLEPIIIVWSELPSAEVPDSEIIEFAKIFHPEHLEALQHSNPEVRTAVMPIMRTLHRKHAEEFHLGNLPIKTNIDDIRKSVARKVIHSLGSYYQPDNAEMEKAVYVQTAIAFKKILGTNEKVKIDGRYDNPQTHAVLSRQEIQRRITGWVRHQLIRKGYIPELAVALKVEVETEEDDL